MKASPSSRIGVWGWLMVIMGWAVGCAAETASEPGLIFYLPFDKDATATVAGGNPAPLASSKPGLLAPGIQGFDMLQDTNTLLQYACTGNYNNAKGSLEFWVKFNTADTNQYHYLFYEEGPYEDGSQILRMFTLGKSGLFYNFRDDRGRWSAAPFPMKDVLGAWHQVVLTWDKDLGDRFYIDGVFQRHRGGTTTTVVHNFQRGTKSHEKMTIGLRQTKAAAVLDEVKIYDRMLSEAEVLQKYQALCPLAVKAQPIIFRQGQPATATLALANSLPTEVKGGT